MKKLRLANTGFLGAGRYYDPFVVGIYTFSSAHPKPPGWPDGSGSVKFDTRSVFFNGYAEFEGRQDDSVLFRGGIVGSPKQHRKRKLIEDLLLVTSLVTGQNWCLYSRRGYPDYPVINTYHLKCVVPAKGGSKAGEVLETALSNIRSATWQTQFAGGFHLRMLRNHANILSTEARYIALVVIWEWLHAHLKNPHGATVNDESTNLNQVIASVLRENWPVKTNYGLLNSKCILSILRNQLAHSGRLPIDRKSAEPWMKSLHCDFSYWSGKGVGVIDYIHFFEQLTQVVVLRTLGIEIEDRLGAFSFSDNLDEFRSTGRIKHRC